MAESQQFYVKRIGWVARVGGKPSFAFQYLLPKRLDF